VRILKGLPHAERVLQRGLEEGLNITLEASYQMNLGSVEHRRNDLKRSRKKRPRKSMEMFSGSFS